MIAAVLATILQVIIAGFFLLLAVALLCVAGVMAIIHWHSGKLHSSRAHSPEPIQTERKTRFVGLVQGGEMGAGTR